MEPTAALGAAVPETSARPSLEDLYAVARRCLLPRRRRLRGRNWDVEDILHDTVILAHLKADRFVPPAGVSPERALTGWILAIAERLAVKRWRRCDESRVELDSADATPDPAPDPEMLAGEAQRRELLAGILHRVRPERAEALVLHACDGLPTHAVAQALGVNANTIKSRIHRGSRDVRVAIERSKLGELRPGPRRRGRRSSPSSLGLG